MYRTGSAVLRTLPRGIAETLASSTYAAVSKLSEDRRLLVARNLQRVYGPDFTGPELERAITRTFESYGAYWVDSFRLPKLSEAEIDFAFGYEGVEHIARSMARGQGTINVLPHLGGWEWAAFWLARIMQWQVTAVVEPLDPPELFDFFTEFRKSLGMHVVPLGPDAGKEVLRALRERHVLALLSDRDIEGNGVEVEFFGERTTLPAGPITLALRTGAPVLPTTVYFDGKGHHGFVRPPLDLTRQGSLREDVARLTQVLAHELEGLISQAPDQWHVFQPNWPSDHEA